MTLQDCYITLGGNFEDVSGRLRSEKMIRKFVLKFLDDPSYALLCSSLDTQNYEEAFRAAHTLKGVCQNLSFTTLYTSSSQLCEALRNGYTPEVPALADQVAQDYQRAIRTIQSYQQEEDT